MKVKSKLFGIFGFFGLLCVAFTPLVLAGCGCNPDARVNITDYLSNVNTAYTADTQNAEIVSKYQELGNSILSTLANTYGATGVELIYQNRTYFDSEGIERPIRYYETFADSMGQDAWAWGSTEAEVFSDENKNLFIQNLFEATLGLNISTAYNATSLSTYADNVDHKGIFYYEADAIAEYILNNIIGTTVVSEDNEKFHDVNNNGTFDYYYATTNYDNLKRFKIINIIQDFNNTNLRATASNKSTEWNSINWGETDFSTWNKIEDNEVYTTDGLYGGYFFNGDFVYGGNLYVGERSQDYKYDQLEFLLYQIDNLDSQRYWDKRYITVNTRFINSNSPSACIFSCFKNYVNTVYYIVYSAVEDLNWQLSAKDTATTAPINDFVLQNNAIASTYQNYTSAVIKAKADISIKTLALAFELDPSITEATTISIYGNYTRGTGSDREATTAKLGEILVNAGDKMTPIMFDFSATSGDNSTEFYRQGVTKLDLKASTSTGNYVFEPSTTFIGSQNNYVDTANDYFEITFETNAKFRFAITDISTTE